MGGVFSFSRSEGQVDISNADSVKKALADVYLREGKIDAVVNTAGVLYKEPLNAMDYEKIIQSIHVNYTGSVILAKESYPYLKETGGSLLLFTSSSYTRGRSFYSLYSSSKAAVVNLMQALNEEWNETGIHINCINPERTQTPMRIKNFGAEPEDTLLHPDTVAAVALNTLCSPITGEIIDVKLYTPLPC